ncbi:zinc finger protein 662-like [Hyperolius riggenbachi]|uniref:zinc finger protein 662-like n=1 Tax=Hyperolius riggenbachi TaxID=752182 RepID=UPI0035A35041
MPKPPKIPKVVILNTILEKRAEILKDGKIAWPSEKVWTELSENLYGLMSPKAVYTFVKRNAYNVWQVLGLDHNQNVLYETETSSSSDHSSNLHGRKETFEGLHSPNKWQHVCNAEMLGHRDVNPLHCDPHPGIERSSFTTGAPCTDHMTASLRMDKDQSHMTEKIFNLTLEIIYLLTGERFPPVKSGDHVTITVPPPHSLISERQNKQKILEVTRKMMELMMGEEWQYLEGHKDLYKDSMMENQPPLASSDGSSNLNPLEGSAGSFYSQGYSWEGPTIPHHDQVEEMIDVKVVVKKEEEEEERYVTGNQQSTMEGEMMRTSKKEEEETYVTGDQQTMDEGKMMRTSKEEEETYVMSGQQSTMEGDMMSAAKGEHIFTEISTAQSPGISKHSEIHLALCKMKDLVTQDSAGRNITSNIPRGSDHPYPHGVPQQQFHPGEKSYICTECRESFIGKANLDAHQRLHTRERPYSCTECGKCFYLRSQLTVHERSHPRDSPYSCFNCGKCFVHKSQLVRHERAHTGEKPFACSECGKCFVWKSSLVTHERSHTGDKPHSCADCGKCFVHKSQLVAHEKSHPRENS